MRTKTKYTGGTRTLIDINDGQVVLHGADCRDVLAKLAGNSIDSVVCDPPYALVSVVKRFGKAGSAPAKHGKDGLYARASAGFMGQSWDTGEVAFAEEFWADVLRVLKPGGHVVAFGGTRTYHRLACAIEDAGFEIRDQLAWTYGSGFPKSHNQDGDWEGWGTALKPAWEPIVLARKALAGTVAGNLAAWGVGAINIDGCRVNSGAVEKHIRTPNVTGANSMSGRSTGSTGSGEYIDGRWPANLLHDGSDEVLAAFPNTKSGVMKAGTMRAAQDVAGSVVFGVFGGPAAEQDTYGDSGSAARFFYCAKASRSDRDEGLEGFVTGITSDGRAVAADNAYQRGKTLRANTHPTVKPTAVMQWLCRLVTPPGGVVLDPFMGSGSTGKAAVLEGFRFVGVEREAEYLPIAEARIVWAVREAEKPATEHARPVHVPANDDLVDWIARQEGAA